MSVTSETIDSLNFVLDAQRVYTELGSVKKLTRLLDDPPKLLNQTDIVLRLNERTGKKKRCRIYIFDKYFIVGAEVKNKKKTLSQIGGESVSDGTSSSGKVVWFGDKNSGEMTSEEAKSENSNENTETVTTGPGAVDAESDSDSDGEDNLAAYRALTAAEAQEKKDKQEYKVKMFVDLAASKPKMVKKDDELAIFFTYVTKTQEEIAPGEYRCDTTVDSAEVWFEDPGKAKNVMGIVQDAIDVLMENILKQKFSKEAKPVNVVENADAESQGDDATDSTEGSVSSIGNAPSTKGARKSGSRSNRPDRTSSGGSSTAGTKKLRKFAKSMETMKKTKAFATSSKQRLAENGGSAPAGVLSFDDVKERYKGFTPDVATHDEGMDAEFTVIFKNPTMGFAMSSSPKIGPFVCRLVADGLAEQSQVTLGDRVMAINDTPIPLTMQWQECVTLIKKYGPPLKITFLRKQKNEIVRQQMVEEAEAKVLAAVEDDNKAAETAEDEEEEKEEKEKTEDPDKVVPVGSESAAIVASSDKEKRRTMLETIELRRKTATSDGKTPAYTIKRKEGKPKRRFAKKRDMYQTEKYNVSKTTDIASFRKNKNELLQQIEDVDSLFATLFDVYKNSKKERTCLFALNEIYVTEKKYLSTLSLIRDVQKMLQNAYVTVLCKDRKTASAFCEHRRPLRFCSQPSKDLEPLVDNSTLNNIFMNIKPMMQAHFFLEKNLRDKLCMLFEGLKNGVSVEIDELLNVFVLAFAEIAPFLQMYWVYCERYQRSVSKYTELKDSTPEVSKLVAPYEKRIAGTIVSALISPVQRITKYPLLFFTLKKYVEDYIKEQKERNTLDKEKEFTSGLMLEQLEKAAAIAHTVATKVNILVGRTEKLDRMAELFTKLGGKQSVPDFLQPFRWFEDNCYIAYEDVSDNSELKGNSILLVLNDMLMIAHITSGEGKGWFRSKSGSLGKLNLSNKLKKISLGKERETSVTPKSTNGGKLSQLGINRDKNFGRKTNIDTNAAESKESQATKEAEMAQYNSETYDCVIRIPLISVLPDKLVMKEKTLDGEEMFGFEVWFSEKQKHETVVKSYNIWIGKSSERNSLKDLLIGLIAEQHKNKTSMQNATDQVAVEKKKKKKKKFASKFADSKAKSIAESKTKKTIVADDGSKRVVSK